MKVAILPAQFERNFDKISKTGSEPRASLLRALGVLSSNELVAEYKSPGPELFINPWALDVDRAEVWLYEMPFNSFWLVCVCKEGTAVVQGTWFKGIRGAVSDSSCFLVYFPDPSAYISLCSFLATGVEKKGSIHRPDQFLKSKSLSTSLEKPHA